MTLRARAYGDGAPAQPRRGGRFAGNLRVNCEKVPRLPAWAVRRVLDDPAQTPHVLIWRESEEEIAEAVRIEVNPECPWPELRGLEVIVSRLEDGRPAGGDFLHGVFRPLPRGGAREFLLVCQECQKPRRHLYAWNVWGWRLQSSPRWPCRRCAGLRYASEGGALLIRSRHWLVKALDGALGMNREPRPGPWDPEWSETKV